MFVIAGVTGNTGAVVADTLLAKGEKVRVIVRDAKKAEAFRARGAEVAVAALEDAGALTKALEGAAGAYFLSPPDLGAKDFLAGRKVVVDAIAQAVEASKVAHVVFLSSIGAHLAEGTGPILSVHYAEKRLPRTPAKLTFIRAGYFFENLASSLGAVPSGKLPTFLRPEVQVSMIATRDIGLTAAQALLEGPQGKVSIVNLEAPRAYTVREVAETLARIVGHPVESDFAPAEAIEPALTGFGLSPDVARLLREMYVSFNEGLVRWENKGEKHLRGATDLETALRGLLASK